MQVKHPSNVCGLNIATGTKSKGHEPVGFQMLFYVKNF